MNRRYLKREAIIRRAVSLRKQNWLISEIALIVGMSASTISQWLRMPFCRQYSNGILVIFKYPNRWSHYND